MLCPADTYKTLARSVGAIDRRASRCFSPPAPLSQEGVTPGPATDEVALPLAGKTEVKMPQSVNFDFQTGLSEKYQLLGMVNARWVDWSNFNVAPPLATLSTQEPLAAYKKD